MRIGLSTVAGPMACVICFGCSKASVTASDAGIAALDAGIATRAPPSALWMQGFDAQLYARALDISCAPPEALPGVEGCIALVRYRGAMNGLSIPASDSESYGSVAFVRIDPAGGVTWAKKLMSGFDPIDIEVGSFVDDDTRVHLLATNEFLVSGTYEGRVFFGTPFFYFQAEDGIRDHCVTGVQTCALPISLMRNALHVAQTHRQNGLRALE